jgi:cytosine permease
MVGGGVAEGIEGWALPVTLVCGALALGALATAQGLLGQRSGRPLLALTAAALGDRASRLTASLAMLAMMLGWFALNTSVAGVALGRLVGVPDAAGMALFALAVLAVVWRGIDALSWSALAAGAATVGLAAYGLATVAGERSLSVTGDGHAAHPMSVVEGIALVVGYGAAFSLRTPDFTHDLARRRDVVWCALVGMFAPVVAFALVGASLLLATGTWNMADVLRELGSPTVAYLFVAIGFTGSVMTNLYSGALSLVDAVPRRWTPGLAPSARHRVGLVVVALAGTGLAALHFSDWMVSYLTIMALSAPALIAVLLLHERLGPARRRGWHPPALLAWALGFAVGLALHLAGSPYALPAGLVATAAAYGGLSWPAAGARITGRQRG